MYGSSLNDSDLQGDTATSDLKNVSVICVAHRKTPVTWRMRKLRIKVLVVFGLLTLSSIVVMRYTVISSNKEGFHNIPITVCPQQIQAAESTAQVLREPISSQPPCGKNCTPKAHSHVILLTYMRSGSTFTGDILSAHPDVFYFYEPMHSIHSRNQTEFLYLKQSARRFPERFKPILKRRTMLRINHCDFESLDIKTLQQFHLQTSRRTRDYFKCLTSNPGLLGMVNCLPVLYTACLKARVILTKTIAFRMFDAETIIDGDPKLKILYLVRDPRATIASHGKYGLYKPRTFTEYVSYFCEIVLEDIKSFLRMKRRFPNRVKLLIYERLSEDPLAVTEDVYGFMGLEVPISVMEHVNNLTMNNQEETCPLCVHKANSLDASQHWRTKLSFQKAKYIDRTCETVYEYLGFKQVTSIEEYLDVSTPLRMVPSDYKLPLKRHL